MNAAARPDLSVSFAGMAMPHPVMVASGCFAYGEPFAPFFDLSKLAGIATKGISPEPRAGNPAPRIWETPAGMLNSIGLENVGVEAFLRDKLPFLADLGVRVWVNFFGEDFDGYVACARALDRGRAHIDVLEMNVSCPNIEKGGIEFGMVPEVAHDLVRACCAQTAIPIVVKLSPNASDNVAIADAVRAAGAAGVSLVNTITGMAVDVRRRRPRLATTYGGLSGPAIKPVALRIVHQVHRALPDLPICGMGGIRSGEDALEFLMAGASCVQIGTANFAEPTVALRVLDELSALCVDLGIDRLAEVVGCLEPWPPEPPWEETPP